MKAPVSLLLLLAAINVWPQKPSAERQSCDSYFQERLESYFRLYEAKADQIINNTQLDYPATTRTRTIRLDPYVIEWTDTVEGYRPKPSLRINGRTISLTNRKSVNGADGGEPIESSVVTEWRQIKLFRLFKQDLIAISMGPASCTGLMCGVGLQLWYDPKSGRETFFGIYRTDFDVRLYRFSNEEKFQVAATNFEGDPHGVNGAQTTFVPYELQEDGSFRIKAGRKGDPYFIKLTIPATPMPARSSKLKKQTKKNCDRLDSNWYEDLGTSFGLPR